MRLEPLSITLDGAAAVPAAAIVAYLASRPVVARDFVLDLADALICEMDALETDPDLEDGADDEPTMEARETGAGGQGLTLNVGLDECEPEADVESSLGAPEVEFNYMGFPHRRGHVDQRHWSDGRAANDDAEPCLGWPEHGRLPFLNRDAWSVGYDRWPEHDECELVWEDEGACVQSQPHDPEEDEPDLGATEHVDQSKAWSAAGHVSGDDECDGWRRPVTRRVDNLTSDAAWSRKV